MEFQANLYIQPDIGEFLIYDKYVEHTFDDGKTIKLATGKQIGIRDDAPQWAKEAYDKWMEDERKARETFTNL